MQPDTEQDPLGRASLRRKHPFAWNSGYSFLLFRAGFLGLCVSFRCPISRQGGTTVHLNGVTKRLAFSLGTDGSDCAHRSGFLGTRSWWDKSIPRKIRLDETVVVDCALHFAHKYP